MDPPPLWNKAGPDTHDSQVMKKQDELWLRAQPGRHIVSAGMVTADLSTL